MVEYSAIVRLSKFRPLVGTSTSYLLLNQRRNTRKNIRHSKFSKTVPKSIKTPRNKTNRKPIKLKEQKARNS